MENTRELAQTWVDEARARGQDITNVEIALEAIHEPLFTMDSAARPATSGRRRRPPGREAGRQALPGPVTERPPGSRRHN
jgi:hypothetical protein